MCGVPSRPLTMTATVQEPSPVKSGYEIGRFVVRATQFPRLQHCDTNSGSKLPVHGCHAYIVRPLTLLWTMHAQRAAKSMSPSGSH